ncbi:transcription initiation factor TFIID subunit 4 isoform X4 [Rhipicephalus sanguineus]|uniref:transcription initiation factor TFIID subunit 4 isoform X4 n=1 Tax=Rhipicephalus sanguineus TaxID=34632 RepID=UPI0018960B89|nr:transcription initiation factor TFIID subunit 4 isoform X4 [Rhipicephalus sanguineus]
MIPKVVSAISIFWVVGVCGATGPTQLNPSTKPPPSATPSVSQASPLASNSGLVGSHGRVSPPSSATLHPKPASIAVGAGTPHKPQTIGTSGAATSNVAVNSTLRVAAAGVPSQTGKQHFMHLPLSATSLTSTAKPSVPQNNASAGGKPIAQQASGSTSTSVRNTQASRRTTSVSGVQNGQPGGGIPPVPPAAGTRNKEPKEPGITAAHAPSVTTRPVVQKPGSQPPKPLNENVARNRPRTQRIVSQTFSEGPLNDFRLVKPTPRRRNEGIYLYVDEKDIPFFPGPLNEPPLSVFVYRMPPELPRTIPRLPPILRMRPAE